jgi:hypothetical protein
MTKLKKYSNAEGKAGDEREKENTVGCRNSQQQINPTESMKHGRLKGAETTWHYFGTVLTYLVLFIFS